MVSLDPARRDKATGSTVERGISAPCSYRVGAGLSGADSDRLVDRGHENLAIADSPRLRCFANRLDRRGEILVGDHDLDLHLGQEINDVFRAAVEFRMA